MRKERDGPAATGHPVASRGDTRPPKRSERPPIRKPLLSPPRGGEELPELLSQGKSLSCRVGLEPTVPLLGVGSLSGRGLGVTPYDFPSSTTLSLTSPARGRQPEAVADPTTRNGFCDAGYYLSHERPLMSQRRKTRSRHTGNIKTPTVRCSA